MKIISQGRNEWKHEVWLSNYTTQCMCLAASLHSTKSCRTENVVGELQVLTAKYHHPSLKYCLQINFSTWKSVPCKSFIFVKSFELKLGICSVFMTEVKLYKKKNNISIYIHTPHFISVQIWHLYFLWMVPWPLGDYCTQPLSAKVIKA